MKNIIKKMALVLLPAALYLCFFIAFEPNNYFGLRNASGSSQPVARLRAYQQAPGTHLILGDSRLAHFDMAQIKAQTGQDWQNLAFGGASLRECIDLGNYILDSGSRTEHLVFGLSFYTINGKYDTDRMSALEDTLANPLAYVLNLEYNVNTLTSFSNFLIWGGQRLRGETDLTWAQAQQESETGEWTEPDYYGADGTRYPVHALLAEYPPKLMGNCTGWYVNEEMLAELETFLALCQSEGVAVTIVLPPMADNVLTEVCAPLGIDREMHTLLPRIFGWQDAYGVTVLDYEWTDAPAFDQDKQYFDGFHLDTVHGLPQWTEMLFADIGA